MNIAIDWDDTYTADPKLFDAITDLFNSSGHTVYCVTARRSSPANRQEVKIPNTRTIFTGYASKTWHMNHVEGIQIDIWIDDDPVMCAFGNDDVKPKTIKLAQQRLPGGTRRR